MANFEEQLIKAQSIQPEIISAEIFAFIKSMSEYLVDLNRKQINEQSEDIYGKAIGFYSKATEILSDGEKRAGQSFTGKDTGNWLDAFYMGVTNNVVYFGSSDPKTDDILDSPNWLSKDLFGLSEDNLWVFINDEVQPFVLNYYRKTIGI